MRRVRFPTCNVAGLRRDSAGHVYLNVRRFCLGQGWADLPCNRATVRRAFQKWCEANGLVLFEEPYRQCPWRD